MKPRLLRSEGHIVVTFSRYRFGNDTVVHGVRGARSGVGIVETRGWGHHFSQQDFSSLRVFSFKKGHNLLVFSIPMNVVVFYGNYFVLSVCIDGQKIGE